MLAQQEGSLRNTIDNKTITIRINLKYLDNDKAQQ